MQSAEFFSFSLPAHTTREKIAKVECSSKISFGWLPRREASGSDLVLRFLLCPFKIYKQFLAAKIYRYRKNGRAESIIVMIQDSALPSRVLADIHLTAVVVFLGQVSDIQGSIRVCSNLSIISLSGYNNPFAILTDIAHSLSITVFEFFHGEKLLLLILVEQIRGYAF